MPQKKDSKAFGVYNNILILTDIEVHAKRDLATIKTFGPKDVQVFSSGANAIDYIADNPVDLIFCDSSLSDMTGIKFAQIVNKNMSGRPMPIIMVTLENRKDHVLDSIASGCIGYILRPYSLDTFEKYLILANQLDSYPEIEEMELKEAKDMVARGDFDDAIEAFEELISYQDEAQKYYDMGCQFMVQGKYGKAIVSFKKAVKINDLFAEAYKGLAEAYKGRGDLESFKKFLRKAADVHAQFDRLEETKTLFIEILKYDAETPNPFNTLGVTLRKQGDYPGAIHAYRQALVLTPHDENIHFNMAKALYFMGKLDDASKEVVSALNMNPGFTEANKLYQRIHGNPWTPAKGLKSKPRTIPEGTKESAKDIGP
ncbi:MULTISPECIES: tetratricopeptide repeat protein [unclassified Pseudodesulfovibrio]|uniref:tetratricopeptide repeat protein n=1 Tax=unclassified Pseudodesulfovibrio TaxID=2661612 RepID=UPI000FEB9A6F|nr:MULTISPECIES: tetratricopeptide repeat protein [unclassified Pseudodesulfovibrio]MCJ2164049.1 tetratricopeptide repeat protein [Pseudodesulfovibrio sp. S3-i]RWU05316.1 tetratricopeptide repeat protein [Pseudodesulfovibrio sp. S3]